MNRKATRFLTLALAIGLCLSGCGGHAAQDPGPRADPPQTGESSGAVSSSGSFSGGSGTENDPWRITTAKELAAVSDDLTASYRLETDIDLSGVYWKPLGTYTPMGDEGGESEPPVSEDAFTGTFDGGSHTISNLTVIQPEGYAVGLFGCIRDARIYNLTVDGATADGCMMVGAVAGYVYESTVTAVSLTGTNTITAHNSDAGSAAMIGGVVGAGTDSVIDSCAAKADIVVPDHSSGAGILCGGLEGGSLVNGYATGTLTAGDNCYGLGAVVGGGFGSEEITRCTAENVRIMSGESAYLIGGVAGYAGGYEDEMYNVAVTAMSQCEANSVEMTLGDGADAAGGILGGGFYLKDFAPYGAPYDAPAVFTIADCTANATINGVEAPLTGTTRE